MFNIDEDEYIFKPRENLLKGEPINIPEALDDRCVYKQIPVKIHNEDKLLYFLKWNFPGENYLNFILKKEAHINFLLNNSDLVNCSLETKEKFSKLLTQKFDLGYKVMLNSQVFSQMNDCYFYYLRYLAANKNPKDQIYSKTEDTLASYNYALTGFNFSEYKISETTIKQIEDHFKSVTLDKMIAKDILVIIKTANLSLLHKTEKAKTAFVYKVDKIFNKFLYSKVYQKINKFVFTDDEGKGKDNKNSNNVFPKKEEKNATKTPLMQTKAKAANLAKSPLSDLNKAAIDNKKQAESEEIKFKKNNFLEKITSIIEICESSFNIYGILLALMVLNSKNINDFTLKSFNFHSYFGINSDVKAIECHSEVYKKEIKLTNINYAYANENKVNTEEELIQTIRQKSYFFLNLETSIANNNKNFYFFYNPTYGLMKLYLDENFNITVLDIVYRAFKNRLGQISFIGASKNGFIIFIPKEYLATKKELATQNLESDDIEVISSSNLRKIDPDSELGEKDKEININADIDDEIIQREKKFGIENKLKLVFRNLKKNLSNYPKTIPQILMQKILSTIPLNHLESSNEKVVHPASLDLKDYLNSIPADFLNLSRIILKDKFLFVIHPFLNLKKDISNIDIRKSTLNNMKGTVKEKIFETLYNSNKYIYAVQIYDIYNLERDEPKFLNMIPIIDYTKIDFSNDGIKTENKANITASNLLTSTPGKSMVKSSKLNVKPKEEDVKKSENQKLNNKKNEETDLFRKDKDVKSALPGFFDETENQYPYNSFFYAGKIVILNKNKANGITFDLTCLKVEKSDNDFIKFSKSNSYDGLEKYIFTLPTEENVFISFENKIHNLNRKLKKEENKGSDNYETYLGKLLRKNDPNSFKILIRTTKPTVAEFKEFNKNMLSEFINWENCKILDSFVNMHSKTYESLISNTNNISLEEVIHNISLVSSLRLNSNPEKFNLVYNPGLRSVSVNTLKIITELISVYKEKINRDYFSENQFHNTKTLISLLILLKNHLENCRDKSIQIVELMGGKLDTVKEFLKSLKEMIITLNCIFTKELMKIDFSTLVNNQNDNKKNFLNETDKNLISIPPTENRIHERIEMLIDLFKLSIELLLIFFANDDKYLEIKKAFYSIFLELFEMLNSSQKTFTQEVEKVNDDESIDSCFLKSNLTIVINLFAYCKYIFIKNLAGFLDKNKEYVYIFLLNEPLENSLKNILNDYFAMTKTNLGENYSDNDTGTYEETVSLILGFHINNIISNKLKLGVGINLFYQLQLEMLEYKDILFLLANKIISFIFPLLNFSDFKLNINSFIAENEICVLTNPKQEFLVSHREKLMDFLNKISHNVLLKLSIKIKNLVKQLSIFAKNKDDCNEINQEYLKLKMTIHSFNNSLLIGITKIMLNFVNMSDLSKIQKFLHSNWSLINEINKDYLILLNLTEKLYLNSEKFNCEEDINASKKIDALPLSSVVKTHLANFNSAKQYLEKTKLLNNQIPKIDFSWNNNAFINLNKSLKQVIDVINPSEGEFEISYKNKDACENPEKEVSIKQENEAENSSNLYDLFIKIDVAYNAFSSKDHESVEKKFKGSNMLLFSVSEKSEPSSKIFRAYFTKNNLKTRDYYVIKNLDSTKIYKFHIDYWNSELYSKANSNIRVANYNFFQNENNNLLNSLRIFLNRQLEFYTFYSSSYLDDFQYYNQRNEYNDANDKVNKILSNNIFKHNRENFYSNLLELFRDSYKKQNNLRGNENITKQVQEEKKIQEKNEVEKLLEKFCNNDNKIYQDLNNFVKLNLKNINSLSQINNANSVAKDSNLAEFGSLINHLCKFDQLKGEIKINFTEKDVLENFNDEKSIKNNDLDLKRGISSNSSVPFLSKKSSNDLLPRRKSSAVVLNQMFLFEIKFEDYLNIKENSALIPHVSFSEMIEIFANLNSELILNDATNSNKDTEEKACEYYLYLVNKLLNLFEFTIEKTSKKFNFSAVIYNKLALGLFFNLVSQEKYLNMMQELIKFVFLTDEDKYEKYTKSPEDLILSEVLNLLENNVFELFYSLYKECAAFKRTCRIKKDLLLEELEAGNRTLILNRQKEFKNDNMKENIDLYEQLFKLDKEVLKDEKENGKLNEDNNKRKEKETEIEIEIEVDGQESEMKKPDKALKIKEDIDLYFTEWLKKLKFIYFFTYKKNCNSINNFISKNSGLINSEITNNDLFIPTLEKKISSSEFSPNFAAHNNNNNNNNFLKKRSSHYLARGFSNSKIPHNNPIVTNDINEIKISNRVRKSLLSSNLSCMNTKGKDEFEKMKKKLNETLKSFTDFISEDKVYIFDVIQSVNANFIQMKFREIGLMMLNSFITEFPQCAPDFKTDVISNFYKAAGKKNFVPNEYCSASLDSFKCYRLPDILKDLNGDMFKGNAEPQKIDFLFIEFLFNILNICFSAFPNNQSNHTDNKLNPYLHIGSLLNCLNWNLSYNHIQMLSKSGFFEKLFLNSNNNSIIESAKKLFFADPLKTLEYYGEILNDNLNNDSGKNSVRKFKDYSICEINRAFDLFYVEKSLTNVFRNYGYFAFARICKQIKKAEKALETVALLENTQDKENNANNESNSKIYLSEVDAKIMQFIFKRIEAALIERKNEFLMTKNKQQQSMRNNKVDESSKENLHFKLKIGNGKNKELNYDNDLTYTSNAEELKNSCVIQNSIFNNFIFFTYSLFIANERVLNVLLNKRYQIGCLNDNSYCDFNLLLNNIFTELFFNLLNANAQNCDRIIELIKIFIKNSSTNNTTDLLNTEIKFTKEPPNDRTLFVKFVYEITHFFYNNYYKKVEEIHQPQDNNVITDKEILRYYIKMQPNDLEKQKRSLFLEFLLNKKMLQSSSDLVLNSTFVENHVDLFLLLISELNLILPKLANYMGLNSNKYFNNNIFFYNSLCDLVRFMMSFEAYKEKISKFIIETLSKNANLSKFNDEKHENLIAFCLDIIGFSEYTLKNNTKVISNSNLISLEYIHDEFLVGQRNKFDNDLIEKKRSSSSDGKNIEKALFLNFNRHNHDIKILHPNSKVNYVSYISNAEKEKNGVVHAKNFIKHLEQNNFEYFQSYMNYNSNLKRNKLLILSNPETQSINLDLDKGEKSVQNLIEYFKNSYNLILDDSQSIKDYFTSISIDEDYYCNFLIQSFQSLMEPEARIALVNLLLENFNIKFLQNRKALFTSYRVFICSMRLFKMIIQQYEKIRCVGQIAKTKEEHQKLVKAKEKKKQLENLNQQGLIESEENYEEEFDQEKGKTIANNFAIITCSEAILDYFTLNSDKINNLSILSSTQNFLNIDNLFNIERVFLYSNLDSFKNIILKEDGYETFTIERVNQSSNDPNSNPNKDENKFSELDAKNTFRLNFSKDNKMMGIELYEERLKLETQIKTDIHHLLTQDIRFIHLYSKNIYDTVKSQEENLNKNGKSENEASKEVESLIYDLKLVKLIFMQCMYKNFYFDLKKDYQTIVTMINNIMLKLFKIDFNEHVFREKVLANVKDKCGYKPKTTKKIVGILALKEVDKVNCSKNEDNLVNGFVKGFHLELLDFIKSLYFCNIQKAIDKRISNSKADIAPASDSTLNNFKNISNNLIDINFNNSSGEKQDKLTEDSVLKYNLNRVYKLIKTLVKEYLIAFFIKLDTLTLPQKENDNSLLLARYVINYVKEIVEIFLIKIQNINYDWKKNQINLSTSNSLTYSFKNFMVKLNMLFSGFLSKNTQASHEKFIKEASIFNEIRKTEEKNKDNLFLKMKSIMDSNVILGQSIKDLIFVFYDTQIKLLNAFPKDLVLMANLDNCCHNFEYVRSLDILENKVNSFSIKNIIRKESSEKDLLDLFAINFNMPLIKNFYYIKLRNNGIKAKLEFSNCTDNPDYFIYLNKIKINSSPTSSTNALGSRCNNNSFNYDIEKFKSHRVILSDPLKTRFTNYACLADSNQEVIIYPDLIKNLELSGLELFFNNPLSKSKTSTKIQKITKSETHNYLLCNASLAVNKIKIKDGEQLKVKEAENEYKTVLESIKKNEKIISLFADSIIITNKSIHVFHNLDLYNKDFLQGEVSVNNYINHYKKIEFERCGKLKNEIIMDAKCNQNCLLLLTLKNKVYYSGRIIKDLKNIDKEYKDTVPVKINFLKGYLCHQAVVMFDTLFFLVNQKGETNTKKKLMRYFNKDINSSAWRNITNSQKEPSIELEIITELDHVSIKKIVSDNHKSLVLLSELNKIYFYGFRTKYVTNNSEFAIVYEGDYDFVEWKWPQQNNYEVIDIVNVNCDFVLISMRKRTDFYLISANEPRNEASEVEYYLIGNYTFGKLVSEEKDKAKPEAKTAFYTPDNPKKIDLLDLYLKYNSDDEDKKKAAAASNTKKNLNVKTYTKLEVGNKKAVEVKRTAAVVTPAVTKTNNTNRNLNTQNERNAKLHKSPIAIKSKVDAKINPNISNKSLIVDKNIADKSINASILDISQMPTVFEGEEKARLESISKQLHAVNFEKAYYADHILHEKYSKYALFFANKYNELNYFEEFTKGNLNLNLDSSTENNKDYYVISIIKLTKENLKEFKDLCGYLSLDVSIASSEMKLIYSVIQIKTKSDSKMLIRPIFLSNNVLDNNFNNNLYSRKNTLEFFSQIKDEYIENLNIDEMLKSEEMFLTASTKTMETKEKFALINLNLNNKLFTNLEKIYDEIKNILLISSEFYLDFEKDNPVFSSISLNDKTSKTKTKLSLDITPVFSKDKTNELNENKLIAKDSKNIINNEELANFVALKNKYAEYEKNKSIGVLSKNADKQKQPTNFKEFYVAEYFKDLDSEGVDEGEKDTKVVKHLESNFEIYDKIQSEFQKAVDRLIEDNKELPKAIEMLKKHKNYLEERTRESLLNLLYRNNSKWAQFNLDIDRIKALKFSQLNTVDKNYSETVFSQVFQNLKNFKAESHMENFISQKNQMLFRVNLIGEGASDGGGPGREIFASIFSDLFSNKIDLFIPTPNQQTDSGSCRDFWTLNPATDSSLHLEFYETLGRVMAYSFFSSNYCDFNLPKIFWKQITQDEINNDDIAEIDVHAFNSIIKVAFDDSEIQKANEEDFPLSYCCFTASLSNGQEVDLIENGAEVQVNKENYKKFRDLYLNARINEAKKQMEAIKKGLSMVFKNDILCLYTWEELKKKVAGSRKFDLGLFKIKTEFTGCANKEIKELFWKFLEEASEEMRVNYLKFVWGRSTLPSADVVYRHSVYVYEANANRLPISHTCAFSLDLPLYKKYETLKKKMTMAINHSFIISDGGAFNINI